jgi:hypothetical protein
MLHVYRSLAFFGLSAQDCTLNGGTPLPEGLCCYGNLIDNFALFGPAVTLDLSAFTPPFSVK